MRVVTNCQSCGKSISAEQVKPGEDDTTPWHVWLPRGHVSVDDLPDRMHYRCPKTLDRHIFFLPKTNPVQDDPDAVKHETWLEYHDRLVKEYYDVDVEWALITEICPELDRPEPAPMPKKTARTERRTPVRLYVVALVSWAITALMLGNTLQGWLWVLVGMAAMAVITRQQFKY